MKEVSFFINEDSNVSPILKHSALAPHFSDRSLHALVVEKGYVLVSKSWHGDRCDGGVVDADLQYITSTGYFPYGGCGYDFDPESAASGNCCIFIGSFHPVYGHAITDDLRKLWFLNTEEGKRLIAEGYEVVYITTTDSKMPEWHLHILELAGVDTSKLVHLHTTTKYEKIVVPDDSFSGENGLLCYTEVFRSTVETIKANVRQSDFYKQAPDNGSYYFTRVGCNDITREMGEPALEKVFRKHGYEIIEPERLPFEQQVSLLMKCRRFASTEGSVSHASIFCNQDSEVVILRKADYENKYSVMIADFVDNRTVFIDAHHSSKANPELPMLGPFYLCVTTYLKKYFNRNARGAFLALRPSYWLYLTSHNRIVNRFLRRYDEDVRRGMGLRRLLG